MLQAHLAHVHGAFAISAVARTGTRAVGLVLCSETAATLVIMWLVCAAVVGLLRTLRVQVVRFLLRVGLRWSSVRGIVGRSLACRVLHALLSVVRLVVTSTLLNQWRCRRSTSGVEVGH